MTEKRLSENEPKVRILRLRFEREFSGKKLLQIRIKSNVAYFSYSDGYEGSPINMIGFHKSLREMNDKRMIRIFEGFEFLDENEPAELWDAKFPW
jgi:hypothetical protein